MSKKFNPQRFGRYVLLDHFKSGGMAEIFRARMANEDDANRLLVIKKIASSYAANEEFVKMFKSEIKVSIGLTHPNIVQIYDYGEHNGTYFLAMEYVEGKDLKSFIKRLKQLKHIFSVDISSYIIAQACSGIHYAHGYKDKITGRPLNIIHRDLSPQNLMISYDGTVKILDFGIAKAESKVDSTRAGTIKGKLGYLAPEYINGDQLDARYDVFALGICLWELLTARRMFSAENELSVLKLIQECKITPPSKYNKSVPKELDEIVMKSLSKDKNQRYQSADLMQRDLHKFLYSNNPHFNPADLAGLAQELFKKEISDDRKHLGEIGKITVDQIADEEVVRGAANVQNPTPSADGSSDDPNKGRDPDMNIVSSADFNLQSMEAANQVGGGAEFDGPAGEADPGATNTTSSVTAKKKGPIALKGQTHGEMSNTFSKPKKKSDLSFLKPLFATGLFIAAIFIGYKQMPEEMMPKWLKDLVGPTIVTVQVEVDGPPDGSTLVVNNKKLANVKFPYIVKDVPKNKTLLIEVQAAGFQTDQREIKVGDFDEFVQIILQEEVKVARTPDTVLKSFGMLNLRSTPPAKVKIYKSGKLHSKHQTPLRELRLAPGKYKVVLENTLLNRKRTVELKIFEKKLSDHHISLID
jgi:serine/threonine-protein kinase